MIEELVAGLLPLLVGFVALLVVVMLLAGALQLPAELRSLVELLP